MYKTEDISRQLDELFKEGLSLQIKPEQKNNLTKLSISYESWFTRAFGLLSLIIPERCNDFRAAYKLENRKEITSENYTISDFLNCIVISQYGKPVFDTKSAYQLKLISQLSILKASKDYISSKIKNIEIILQTNIFINLIEESKELVREKHLRSAGVICGLILAQHLITIFEYFGIKPEQEEYTLSDINNSLHQKDIYDTKTWGFIQRLIGLRSLFLYAIERELSIHEVNDFIEGISLIIKEVKP